MMKNRLQEVRFFYDWTDAYEFTELLDMIGAEYRIEQCEDMENLIEVFYNEYEL